MNDDDSPSEHSPLAVSLYALETYGDALLALLSFSVAGALLYVMVAAPTIFPASALSGSLYGSLRSMLPLAVALNLIFAATFAYYFLTRTYYRTEHL